MQSAGSDVSFEAPISIKGDYVVLKALQDRILSTSACPFKYLETDKEPRVAHFGIRDV